MLCQTRMPCTTCLSLSIHGLPRLAMFFLPILPLVFLLQCCLCTSLLVWLVLILHQALLDMGGRVVMCVWHANLEMWTVH